MGRHIMHCRALSRDWSYREKVDAIGKGRDADISVGVSDRAARCHQAVGRCRQSREACPTGYRLFLRICGTPVGKLLPGGFIDDQAKEVDQLENVCIKYENVPWRPNISARRAPARRQVVPAAVLQAGDGTRSLEGRLNHQRCAEACGHECEKYRACKVEYFQKRGAPSHHIVY